MKRFAFAITIILTPVASCVPTPTSQPQSTLATLTPQTAAVTATTPSRANTPTATTVPTLMGTPAITPLLANTPTPTPFPSPPNLEGLTPTFSWEVNLRNPDSRQYPEILTAEGSRTEVINDPTGSGVGLVFMSEIYSSIPSNGGLLKDGTHRPYVAMGRNNQLDSACWGLPAVYEVTVYLDQLQPEIGKSGYEVKDLAGGSLLEKYGAYAQTQVVRSNGERLYIVPVAYPNPNATYKDAINGKIVDSSTNIPEKTWVRLRQVITEEGIWTMVAKWNHAELGFDKFIVSAFVKPMIQNPRICLVHFGPYASGHISNFKMYQAGNSVQFYGERLGR